MKPEPIKDVIKGVIKTWSEKSTDLTEEDILRAWRDAAGKRMARHSKPTSFKSSRLVVSVDSSGWLYELSLNKTAILKKLKKKFKKKLLKEIQFRIGEV